MIINSLTEAREYANGERRTLPSPELVVALYRIIEALNEHIARQDALLISGIGLMQEQGALIDRMRGE